MSDLATPQAVRHRILGVEDLGLRRYLAAVYLFAARPNELCGLSTATSKAIGPTGKDVSTDIFEGKEAYLFTLKTEKRNELPRTIGLPGLDFEPWAKPLYEHIKAAAEAPAFPFTRYWVTDNLEALGVFEGLDYQVEQYGRMAELGGQKVLAVVKPHLRPLSPRGLRHVRARELRVTYKLTPEEKAAYMGHTISREVGMSATYDTPQWWEYFPKLLRPRT